MVEITKMIKMKIKWEMIQFPLTIERINRKIEGARVAMDGLPAATVGDLE